MSKLVSKSEYDDGTFELGETVEFDGPYGDRMIGEIVRVYNTRYDYHVEVDDERYSVTLADNIRRVDVR